MARAGLAKEQLTKGGGLNFGTGNGEIVAAAVLVHQFPPNKNTGDQEEPRCKVRLTIQRMDKDWKPMAGEEPIEEYIAVAGKGGLAKFHPGQAEGPDDEDPSDLGDDLGAEGDSIVAIDGAQVNENSKLGIFTSHLQDAGFKPEYLNGYLPNLVGLQAHFVTKKMKATEEGMKDWDVLTVDKIQRFPYQKGGAKPAATTKAPVKAAPASKAPVKAAGKPNGKPAATPPASEGADADSEATRLLTALGQNKAGQTMTRLKEGPPANRIPSQAAVLLGKLGIAPELHTEVLGLIADDEWFLGNAELLGWAVEGDTVTIASE